MSVVWTCMIRGTLLVLSASFFFVHVQLEWLSSQRFVESFCLCICLRPQRRDLTVLASGFLHKRLPLFALKRGTIVGFDYFRIAKHGHDLVNNRNDAVS